MATKSEIQNELDNVTMEMRSLMDAVKDTSKEVNLDEVRAKKAELEEKRSNLAKQLAEFDRPNENEERKNEGAFIEVRSGPRESRDVTMSVGGGGAAIAPQQFVNELIKEVEKDTALYKIVRKMPVTGAGSLGVPYEKADASDASWTAEIPDNDIASDTTWEFGKRELSPSDLVKQILFTKKLLACSALPIEQLTREKIAEKLAAAFESGIISGDGSGKPLGVFTASNDGIPTSRDVAAINATEIVADDLINMKMNLRPAYRKNAKWVMSTAALTQVMKLKDKNGQYLWTPSLRDGEPDRVLGLPVIESEFAPSTIAANQYTVVLGDFDYYWFAYWKGIELQVLTEKFAGKNQIGVLGHTLADGMPVLPAAFTRLKMSALNKVETPVASPVAGTYDSAQSVSLSCGTTGATIYYTLDGTTPTSGSTQYSSAISISSTKTLKAIAIKNGMTNSDVLSALFTISG